METEKHSAPNAPQPAGTNGSIALASESETTWRSTTATIADGTALLGKATRDLLSKRGIDANLAEKMGWRDSPGKGNGDWIEIPYFVDGKHVNSKFRTLSGEKRFYQTEGGVKCLWNVDCIKDLGDKPLIICEGEMDAAIALQCGYMAISVPDGAPKDAIGERETVKYAYLDAIPESLKNIILATDSDNPGFALLHDLSIRLGKHRCKWVKYPLGCKDLNDTFQRYGAKGVHAVMERAQWVQVDGIYRMSELPPLPVHPAVSVGIEALEPHFRLRKGDFSVITGVPSHGKSTFVNNISVNLAKTHGWHITFASFEQPPQTEHLHALRTLIGGRPANCLDDNQRTAADAFIERHFGFIVPDDDSAEDADLVWLIERARSAVLRYGSSMVVVDPWNEIDHYFDSREMTMTQYVGAAIKQFKKFARAYQVHVMVVAHPAKLRKDKDGFYPVPTLYDISDSANWYNKADQGLIVHRGVDETQPEITTIRVAKSRYHRTLGKPGDVELRFSDHDYQFRGA